MQYVCILVPLGEDLELEKSLPSGSARLGMVAWWLATGENKQRQCEAKPRELNCSHKCKMNDGCKTASFDGRVRVRPREISLASVMRSITETQFQSR